MKEQFPTTDSKDPIEILKFVAREVIRKEPKRYNQHEWALFFSPNAHNFIKQEFPSCGTICCVAGAVVLSTQTPIDKTDTFAWSHEARKILGLDIHQANDLFDGDAIIRQMIFEDGGDPDDEDLFPDYEDVEPNRGSVEYAELGIRHIERFMREEMGYTGEAL